MSLNFLRTHFLTSSPTFFTNSRLSANLSKDEVSVPITIMQKMRGVTSYMMRTVSLWHGQVKDCVSLKESFFIKSTQDVGYQNYQAWCADLRIAIRHLHIIQKKESFYFVFQKALLNLREQCERNCLSPIHYHECLTKLEHRFKEGLKLPSQFADRVREIRVHFRDTLLARPRTALRHFYHDIVNNLIQVSCSALSPEKLTDKLAYYKGLVSDTIYQEVLTTLQQHSTAPDGEQVNGHNGFYSKIDVLSSHYEKLLTHINLIFSTFKKLTKNQVNTTDAKITSYVKPCFMVFAIATAVGVLTNSLPILNEWSQELIQIGRGWSRLSSSFSLPVLSQATLGYGLYHQLSLPFPTGLLSIGGVLIGLSHISAANAALDSQFELSTLNGTNGFVVSCEFSGKCMSMGSGDFIIGDYLGVSIDSGDVNGDNISDFLINRSPFLSPNGTLSYIIFGSRNPFMASFNLSSLDGFNGLAINTKRVDYSFSSINHGDINGDGISDILIGNPYAPSIIDSPGLSYVVFGSRSFPASLHLSNLNGTNGFLISGNMTDDLFGFAIGSGDLNGDKIKDLLIGAPSRTNYEPGHGYVIYGSETPFPANFQLNSINGSNGFVVDGIYASHVGTAISSGDINGDGIDDLFIGSWSSPTVFVLFGSQNPFPTHFNLTDLNGGNGFAVRGIAYRVALNSGDINNDGIADLLIGNYGFAKGTGSTLVIYGSKNPFPALFEIDSLDGKNGFAIHGIEFGDNSGYSLSSGDFNGDHLTDLFIGAPRSPSGFDRGEGYVIFGSRSYPARFDLSSLNGHNGFMINGIKYRDRTGYAMSCGDINGDQLADILISAPAHNTPFGKGYVVFGHKDSSHSSSQDNKNYKLISLIAGPIAAGVYIIAGGVALALWKKYKKPIPVPRKDKDRTLIANKYEIINKINIDEAEELFKQTGIKVLFKDNVMKVKLVQKNSLAYDKNKKRYVAIKKIKGAQVPTFLKQEALQKKLNGLSNIMPSIDLIKTKSGKRKSVVYHLTPLAGFGTGHTLISCLSQCQDLGLKQRFLVHAAKGLLTGIKNMHRSKIYHLNIKPANIAIDIQGEIFVTDFSCAIQTPVSMKSIKEIRGDKSYFPPEWFEACRQKTDQALLMLDYGKADAWALGVTLLELALGKYPFDAVTSEEERIALCKDHYFKQKLATFADLKAPAEDSYFAVVKGLLNLDPNTRLSVKEALAQPIFQLEDSFFAQANAFSELKKAVVEYLPTDSEANNNLINENTPLLA